MRNKLTIALLAVCATLLAANLVVSLRTPAPTAFGQATGAEGGGYVLATGQSQGGSDQVLWVFQIATKKVAAYSVKSQGIEYKGVRNITWDLIPDELKPRSRMSVDAVQDLLKKQKKSK